MLEIIKNLFVNSALAVEANPFVIKIAPPKDLPKAFLSIETAVPVLFNIAIIASFIAFMLLFVLGGVKYLSSAGAEEETTKAKKWLVDAVIGLIIVISTWAIGTWILSVFGIK